MRALASLLFFGSGLSGLIYQVVWVRVFGNVFGNTVYSAALIVSIFMLGLGAGSYLGGQWADRRYRTHPDSLLAAYGVAEIAIALLGVTVSLTLPHLDVLSEWGSTYVRDATGWWVLSSTSHLTRAAAAALLVLPITLLMGATLPIVARHLVRERPGVDGWMIALLYATNTAGAAVGALLPDMVLLPALGLFRTQLVAVAVNALVGAVALAAAARAPARAVVPAMVAPDLAPTPHVTWMAVAVAMSGFAAVGLEIAWLRHVGMLLGGFRAVFALLLTVILVGIGIGALLAAWLERRSWWGADPFRAGRWLIVIQGLIAAAALAGVAGADLARIDAALLVADPSGRASPPSRLSELWFNGVPIALEVALPALLMGFGFPLANALVQRAEAAVGRRTGALYLANTAGAVAGSLAAGFVLLPTLGLQHSMGLLAATSAASAIPIFVATVRSGQLPSTTWTGSPRAALATSLAFSAVALWWWQQRPPDAVLERALPRLGAEERRLTLDEGLTEVIAVTEVEGRGRRLQTNGHPMSATWPLSQRYMRALAHLPLLALDQPATALVIGFGVGNTTHAVTLHPSIARVEVADLSRAVLEHANFFASANANVLADPRVQVFINDGRHHLRMRPPASFDLITLEPPPIAYAGAAALYSREFYELARTRLTEGGFISQWLPVYQVPGSVTLAMVRAFVDVFPDAVLVSGAGMDLLLIGTTRSPYQVDPDVLERRLRERPAVHADLARVDLGTVAEIVGAFVGAPSTLRAAAASTAPATDDRPIQELAVRSLFTPDTEGLAAIADLDRVAEWCPRCYRDGAVVDAAAGLDLYVSLMRAAYTAPPDAFRRVRELAPGTRRVAGSAYLGAVLPDTATVHNLVGVALASEGQLDEAEQAFRQALTVAPTDADGYWHLGATLAAKGLREDALRHLQQAVRLAPTHGPARYDLARALVASGAESAALAQLRAAVDLMPDSADAHNDLGALLARSGATAEAIVHFRRALALRPDDEEVAGNLARAGARTSSKSPR